MLLSRISYEHKLGALLWNDLSIPIMPEIATSDKFNSAGSS